MPLVVIALVVLIGGLLFGGCARQPITTASTGATSPPPSYGSTVTTSAITTTTDRPPPTTAPPTTEATGPEAPGTTVAPGPSGATKVFAISADTEIEVRLNDVFEISVLNDPASGFTWKADIAGTAVKATGLRTDQPATDGQPSSLVGVYTAGETGSATVTFSQAKGDGTPGSQWKVTVTVV